MLNFLSKKLKGREASGFEVDYLSSQPGTKLALQSLQELDEPGKIQQRAESQYNALQNEAFTRLKAYEQKGTR